MTARRARRADRGRRRALQSRRTTTAAGRRRARRWSRSVATAGPSWRRTPTSTWSWSPTRASTSASWPRRSGTRSGTPGRSSTTRCARCRRWSPRPTGPAGRLGPARHPPPRRRPEPDPAAADHDARPLAARGEGSGCPSCTQMVRSRHELIGELAHLSVPDLKEAEGGLRDATMLKALVATWLVDVPHTDLERCRQSLLDVRDLVHGIAGRATDRIAPEMWSELAAALGTGAGEPGERAAQVHVRELGRRITHLSRLTWRRVDDVLRPADVAEDGAPPVAGAAGAGRGARARRGGARQDARARPTTRCSCCAPRPPPPSTTRCWRRRPPPGWCASARRCPTPGPPRRASCWCGCSPPGAACSGCGRRSRRPAP